MINSYSCYVQLMVRFPNDNILNQTEGDESDLLRFLCITMAEGIMLTDIT